MIKNRKRIVITAGIVFYVIVFLLFVAVPILNNPNPSLPSGWVVVSAGVYYGIVVGMPYILFFLCVLIADKSVSTDVKGLTILTMLIVNFTLMPFFVDMCFVPLIVHFSSWIHS
jgi:hypothetical protein